MYDIAVVGLGPAGAFLVGHLSKNYSVIAIDKKLPGEKSAFRKPCGGLLSPDAQKSLSRFNMTLPKDILVGPQIFSVRTIDVKTGLVRNYQRHYINLDRHKFDSWLTDQIPEHVEVQGGATCTNIVRDGDGFKITYTQNHSPRDIHAKYLVGADGASSIVRRSLFGDFRINTYLSIQQWFADTHNTPFYSCVFDPDITDSYAWGLTKDDSFIFGGAFKIKTARQDFEALKEKLRPYGFRLESPTKTEACLVLRPRWPGNYCYGGDGAFLIGEAAGFISPSSLEGISYAIDSGYALSQCLNNHKPDSHRKYRKSTRKTRVRLALKFLKRPFLYCPLSRKLIMKSGLQAVNVLKQPDLGDTAKNLP